MRSVSVIENCKETWEALATIVVVRKDKAHHRIVLKRFGEQSCDCRSVMQVLRDDYVTYNFSVHTRPLSVIFQIPRSNSDKGFVKVP